MPRILKGIVLKRSSDKTVSVEVSTLKQHKLYGKVCKFSKKYLVHDESNCCHEGDIVSISETAPISKRKSWILHSVNKVAEGV